MSIILHIKQKLTAATQPTHLEILNESGMHSVPNGSESHLKIILVSDLFENKSLLARQRLINEILKEELRDQIHACSMLLKTPAEWNQTNNITASPPCLGGSKLKETI